MLSETLSDRPHAQPAAGRDESGHRAGDHRHLAGLFESAARANAERIAAVETGLPPLTYRALEQCSGALARRLAQAGIGRGAFVALCAGRSIQALVAMVAIVRSGAAYVPLDPSYPDAQLAYMLADAGPALILAEPDMQQRLAGIAPCAKVWSLADSDEAATGPAPDLRACDPADPAYVMYTSGSTGRPKGVVVPHRGVAQLVAGGDFCDLGPQEVILHLAPLTFDASTFEIWSALLHGGRLAIVPPKRPSLDVIANVLTEQGVTTALMTTGVFNLIVDGRIAALTGLRQLLVGGDALSPEHVGRLLAAAPGCRFINGYGPTEHTTFACCATVEPAHLASGRVPIGRAVAGTEVFIVDEALRPVARGEQGQLVTSGTGLALGYLGQEALTRERFVEAPVPIARRVYLTGDLACARPDGTIDYLGRIDRQMKIDGKRVEPGEIEAALRRGAGVTDACVLMEVRPNGAGRLLGFIALEEGAVDEDAVVQATMAGLREDLPAHMWPARVVPMRVFPLTPNGKIDRAALLARFAGQDAAGSCDAAPAATDDLPGRILAIWQKVLGTARIGPDETFFELGGTSLQWMQLHAEIETRLGRTIAIVDLFAWPTLRLMTEHLGGAPDATSGNVADAARERARRQRAAAMRRTRAS